MSDQLDDFLPQPAALEVAGVHLEVRALPIGKIARLMAHLRPVLRAWNDLADEHGGFPYLALMERAGDDCAAAVAIAVDRPVEWVGALDMADHIRLAEAIIGANPDFFAQLIREDPLTRSLVARLTAGPTSSPDSSTPDIATPT